MIYGYCIECNMMTYLPIGSNGEVNWQAAAGKCSCYSHHDKVISFDRKMKDYPLSLQAILLKMDSKGGITDADIAEFRLALDSGNYDKFMTPYQRGLMQDRRDNEDSVKENVKFSRQCDRYAGFLTSIRFNVKPKFSILSRFRIHDDHLLEQRAKSLICADRHTETYRQQTLF